MWGTMPLTEERAVSCIGLIPGADLLFCAETYFMVGLGVCSTQLYYPR